MTPAQRDRIVKAAMLEYENVKKYCRPELARALRENGPKSVFTATLDSLYRACAAAAKRGKKHD